MNLEWKKSSQEAGPDKADQKAEQGEAPQGQDPTKKRRRRRRRRRGKGGGENPAVDANVQQTADTKQNNQHKNQNNSQVIRKPVATYGAIDLGTNNCRLLVAKPTPRGFRVVDAFSRVVRLGEGVAQTGLLSDDAMDRTVEALKVCADKLERRKVRLTRNVATEACRVADNVDMFLDRIKHETNIDMDVISAAEEARLAVMGCQSLISTSNRHALVFDIGGGSTELIWVKVLRRGYMEIQGWTSIPWGVVNLTETINGDGGQVSTDMYDEMRALVEDHLVAFEVAHSIEDTVQRRRVQFLGTSGTVTTLASLHLKLPRYNRARVDGAWMSSKDIKALSKTVALMTPEEREAQPCIGAERADLVVAGCAILDAILGMWSVRSLRVADRGIREGILRGLMKTDKEPRTAAGIDMS